MKGKIIVQFEGGVIQWAITDDPQLVGVTLEILDNDADAQDANFLVKYNSPSNSDFNVELTQHIVEENKEFFKNNTKLSSKVKVWKTKKIDLE